MRVVYVINNSLVVWLTDWAEGDDWTADEWTGSVSFSLNLSFYTAIKKTYFMVVKETFHKLNFTQC